MNREFIRFNTGDTIQTHTIVIRDDVICERDPDETFLSIITLEEGDRVLLVRRQTTVVIIDDPEEECGMDSFMHSY